MRKWSHIHHSASIVLALLDILMGCVLCAVRRTENKAGRKTEYYTVYSS